MRFYIVCGWDQYYPYGGIDNIMLVTTSQDEVLDFVDREDVKPAWERKDCYEVYDSADLPWSDTNNLSETSAIQIVKLTSEQKLSLTVGNAEKTS